MDALASPSWQFPEASFFFWIIFGLGLASLRREEGQTVPAEVPSVSVLSPLRRAGAFALSGSVAVVLAAQVLPTGLLTPVEAYNHVAASVYQGVTLTQVSCPTSTGYCFSLTAVYSDGSHDVTLDSGGVTGIQTFFTCKFYPSPNTCNPTFSYGTSTRNQLIIHSSEVGQQIIITGSFEDVSYPVTVGVGTPTATPHTSAGIILTPSVINVSP